MMSESGGESKISSWKTSLNHPPLPRKRKRKARRPRRRKLPSTDDDVSPARYEYFPEKKKRRRVMRRSILRRRSRTEQTIRQTRQAAQRSHRSRPSNTARNRNWREKITNGKNVLDKKEILYVGWQHVSQKEAKKAALASEEEFMRTNLARGIWAIMLALNDFAIASTRSLILSSSPPARTLPVLLHEHQTDATA